MIDKEKLDTILGEYAESVREAVDDAYKAEEGEVNRTHIMVVARVMKAKTKAIQEIRELE